MFGSGLVAASFGLTAALYSRLPSVTPTHFNLMGQADCFVAKPLGPFVVPLIGLLAHGITVVVLRRQKSALHVIPVALAALFVAANAVLLRSALDATTDTTRVLIGGSSLFVAVLGNYLAKIRRNGWLGIRTPWTLADDEVWQRTHRLAGWLFVAVGSACFLAAVGGAPIAMVSGALAIVVTVPVVYSYVVFRRIAASHGRPA